jgi:large subunit ribosomal protein L15
VADEINLSSLQPAQARKDRKRVGRGLGSGKGRYSGRGIKGQKARSGSAKMRAGFEGGQMPLYMRVGKQRGSTSKDAMPIGPFRTSTVPVNVRDLERFDEGADVTPDALVGAGVIKNTKVDVKILGQGDLTKRLSVTAHAFSVSARQKIEAAGGSVTLLRGDSLAAAAPGRASKTDESGAAAADDAEPTKQQSDGAESVQGAAASGEVSAADTGAQAAEDDG